MYKHEVHKFSTWLKSASHCRSWRKIFQNYSLELVQASLSHFYNNVNTAVDYCTLPVYRHVLSATALDGDVQLNSSSKWLSPQKVPPVRSEFEAWRSNQKGRNGQRKFSCTIMWTEPSLITVQYLYTLDGDVHLSWTSEWLSQRNGPAVRKFPCTIMWTEPRPSRP